MNRNGYTMGVQDGFPVDWGAPTVDLDKEGEPRAKAKPKKPERPTREEIEKVNRHIKERERYERTMEERYREAREAESPPEKGSPVADETTGQREEENESASNYPNGNGGDVNSNGETTYFSPVENFPKGMSDDAFYGIAGEIVDLIYPFSEATKEALLVQFLVGFGNIIGRKAKI